MRMMGTEGGQSWQAADHGAGRKRPGSPNAHTMHGEADPSSLPPVKIPGFGSSELYRVITSHDI